MSFKKIFLLLLFMTISSKGISSENRFENSDNTKIKFITLTNSRGIKVKITNYGGRVVSLWTPDKNNNFDDIVLGFETIDEYMNTSEKYFGCIVGRYANRINNGSFKLNNIEYKLKKNNAPNHLHGGEIGFDSVIWKIQNQTNNSITLTYRSYHLEEGYPGNLDVKVTYKLTEKNELKIQYWAYTDQKTIVNLTHHSFFNLKGAGNGSINDHLLEINASNYTPVNKNLIPTGQIKPVKNTPFDFSKLKPIGSDIKVKNDQLSFGQGYDHNYVLNKKNDDISFAAKVIEPESKRVMEVYTNEPGLQFYGGNFLDGSVKGKNNKTYNYRTAFCLETQHFPDSPNNENFPSTELNPGEEYYSICIYKFSVIE